MGVWTRIRLASSATTTPLSAATSTTATTTSPTVAPTRHTTAPSRKSRPVMPSAQQRREARSVCRRRTCAGFSPSCRLQSLREDGDLSSLFRLRDPLFLLSHPFTPIFHWVSTLHPWVLAGTAVPV